MVDKFRASDATEWNSHGNMGRGKVKKQLARRTLIQGHAVAAEEGRAGASPPEPDEREPQQLIDPAQQSDG